MDQTENIAPASTAQSNPACPKCMTEISQLVNQTWQLYKQKIFACIQVQLVIIVPAIILGIIATLIILALVPTLNSTSDVLNTILIITFAIVIIVIIIAALIIGAWFQAALMIAISNPENLNVFTIYKKAAKYIFPFIWVMLITALVSLPGYIIFIIPGVIITIWLYLSSWTLIDQNQFGFDALAKAKALVSGKWWDILARVIIIGIIVYLINMIIAVIVMPITFVTAFVNLEFIANIIQAIISIFITPIPLIFTYLIYQNLVTLRPADTLPKTSKTWMIVLAIVSVVLIIIGILIALALGAFGALFSSDILNSLS